MNEKQDTGLRHSAAALFDYSVVSSDASAKLQETERIIEFRVRQTIKSAIEIGAALNRIKDTALTRGQFDDWVSNRLPISVRTAYNAMAVANAFIEFADDDCNTFITLEAFYRIASSNAPKEAREEVLMRARRGERINRAKAIEIIDRHLGIQKQRHQCLPGLETIDCKDAALVDSETVRVMTGFQPAKLSKLERAGVLVPIAKGPGSEANGREYQRAYYPSDVVAYICLKEQGKFPPTREELLDVLTDEDAREGFVLGLRNPGAEEMLEKNEMSKAFLQGFRRGVEMAKRFPSARVARGIKRLGG